MFAVGCVINAQSTVSRKGNTFEISSSKTKSEPIKTKFTAKIGDTEYPIYITNNGSCFVNKTSSKTSKQYRYYLDAETSKIICKELNVEYKSKKSVKK